MILLVVDDDRDDQEIFCEAVKSIDPAINCIIVNDGVEALEYLNQNTLLPDFIFLDINMPRMDGRECLTLIRADSRFDAVTVVMYSTAVSPSGIDTFKRMGAFYLQKPSNIFDLTMSLMEILKSKPGI